MITQKLVIVLISIFLMAAGAALAGGDAKTGKTKAAACAGCHGENGEGIEPNPGLAGLEEDYLVEQLKAFKEGTRADPMMQMFSTGLSEQDMADLAAFYATLAKE